MAKKTPAGQEYDEQYAQTFEPLWIFDEVRKQVDIACESLLKVAADPHLNGCINESEVRSSMKTLRDVIANAKPHAICMICDGTKTVHGSKCRGCRGHGWVNKRTYDLMLKRK